VPLSAAAVAIIEKLPRFKEGDFVFTTTSGELAINGFSKLKERIDGQVLERRQQRAVEANANPKKVKNLEDWTLHDIRRTATTRMAGLQVLPHVLSAVLGHSTAVTVSTKPSAAVTKIYNQYNYIDEKRQALEVWAQYVLSLGKPATKAASA
jgi:integrase